MGSIVVTELGKAYRQYPTRWSRLREWLTPWRGPNHSLKWVLQGISFRVSPGEAVGIIGINGAGKSTLLKLITGIIQPTTGSAQMGGRAAALLELGMGFHPDFTGRQNAIMAGQLLGLQAREIGLLMPSIEAFAEIGEYIDQPVRVYSSGMQVRLAFAVATAVRPDILIVDEALSVGDAYFQHKSFDRIRRFREQGTTLLIVSHDRMAIQSICDRAILLDRGHLVKGGAPEEVMDFYNALIAERGNATVTQRKTESGRVQTISGSGEATVAGITLLDDMGNPVEAIDVGAPVTLCVRVRINAPIPRLVLGYMIKDRLGQAMFGINTHLLEMPIENMRAGEMVDYRFAFQANLGPGSYSVTVALHRDATHVSHNYEWKDLAYLFEVINLTKRTFSGCSWLEPECTISRRDSPEAVHE
ncbi:MAG: ABC transporter ATP-binding protein [Burkholderiales bacterium]|nr:ABC transporter ATP-binding protein [Burkholderiales bacterium]